MDDLFQSLAALGRPVGGSTAGRSGKQDGDSAAFESALNDASVDGEGNVAPDRSTDWGDPTQNQADTTNSDTDTPADLADGTIGPVTEETPPEIELTDVDPVLGAAAAVVTPSDRARTLSPGVMTWAVGTTASLALNAENAAPRPANGAAALSGSPLVPSVNPAPTVSAAVAQMLTGQTTLQPTAKDSSTTSDEQQIPSATPRGNLGSSVETTSGPLGGKTTLPSVPATGAMPRYQSVDPNPSLPTQPASRADKAIVHLTSEAGANPLTQEQQAGQRPSVSVPGIQIAASGRSGETSVVKVQADVSRSNTTLAAFVAEPELESRPETRPAVPTAPTTVAPSVPRFSSNLPVDAPIPPVPEPQIQLGGDVSRGPQNPELREALLRPTAPELPRTAPVISMGPSILTATVAAQSSQVALMADLPAILPDAIIEELGLVASGSGVSASSVAGPIAPTSTPVPMIAQQIAQTLRDPSREQGGTVELALDPPELGRVRLSLTEVNGVMTLLIQAERGETAELMRRHLDLLAEEFERSGLDAPNVEIAGEESRDNPNSDGAHPASAGSEAAASDGPENIASIPANIRAASGGLDIRL